MNPIREWRAATNLAELRPMESGAWYAAGLGDPDARRRLPIGTGDKAPSKRAGCTRAVPCVRKPRPERIPGSEGSKLRHARRRARARSGESASQPHGRLDLGVHTGLFGIPSTRSCVASGKDAAGFPPNPVVTGDVSSDDSY